MKVKKMILLIGILFTNHILLGQDGHIDPFFNTIGAFNGRVLDTKVQTDGKVVVVGEFTNRIRPLVNLTQFFLHSPYRSLIAINKGVVITIL